MKHSKYAPLQTPAPSSLVIPAIGSPLFSIFVDYLRAYSDALAVPSCRTGSAGKNKSHVQLLGRLGGVAVVVNFGSQSTILGSR